MSNRNKLLNQTLDQILDQILVANTCIADPLDMPLPCDIKVGSGTMCKGLPLRTLVIRMKILHSYAIEKNGAEVINAIEALQIERNQLQEQLSMALATIEGMATQ